MGKWGLGLALALALAGCDDESTAAGADAAVAVDLGQYDAAGGAGGEGGEGGQGGEGGEGGQGGAGGAPVARPDCDALMPAHCALPWPSSFYLTEGEGGRVLDFGPTSLPANRQGVHIDPAPYRVLDGFGVQTPALVVFPNLDASLLADETRIADSLADDAPVLLYAVGDDGLIRVPYYAELDPKEDDPARKILFVRPAVLLEEGTRYIWAFRDLRDTAGQPIAASEAFQALRDGATADDPALAARQPLFDEILALLEAEGVDRGGLVLAYDFWTASSQALHGDLLFMRRDGFERTGPTGPELSITAVEEFAAEADDTGRAVNPDIAYEFRGVAQVPHYMQASAEFLGSTGWVFRRDAEGRPLAEGTREVEFWVRVPHSAVGGEPHGLVQYGHGQLGRGTQVRGGDKGPVANAGKLIFFASTLVGMSAEEEVTVTQILQEMSHFPWIADRLHQGILEHLLLMRAMRERFDTLPEVAERGVVVDKARSYYSGISQGGIFGATLMALAPNVTRGHLGVPGQDYFTLLGRSQNFVPLFVFLAGGYPDVADQWVTLQAIQQLWNKTDPSSYYRHISAEPFEDDAPHAVLAAPAQGDYQVAPITMEIIGRSGVGIPLMANYSDERQVALADEAAYPRTGSGVVNWDLGNAWAPPGNQPPPDDPAGDPHGDVRRLPHHNAQMLHFWDTGEIIDVCGGATCQREPPAQ
ncbi:MAG: hypothetical protein H6702_20335 [Myxococcales bacterium]|nr:hypothetical protein [Myxococcales bacterium]